MSGERGHVTSVADQRGGRVLLSLPMVGFPEGFELRPGERVVLVEEESGPAVRPLVRAEVVPRQYEGESSFEVSGRPYVLQPSTVRGEAPEGAEDSDELVVWVVDSDSPDEPGQVIAVRPRG
ncbi:MAG TPA: hypothetical protein VKU40_14560 [Thermoanaerobaculia bacterium]|nr:hypothetical protein [Thermoanaerobaculia bacterium]